MPKHSPVNIRLGDLIELKKNAESFLLAQSDRKALTGFGNTYSPFKSRGLDFQEVRAYQPGDDIRQIDWHVTAKYGKPFTKLYTEEKERSVFFVVDLRSNMHFATHGDFKSVVAARLAAFMAAMANHQQDKISYLLLTDTGIISGGKPETDMLSSFLHDMTEPKDKKARPGSWQQLLLLLTQLLPLGSFVFLFSDFYDWQPDDSVLLANISDKNTFLLVSIYDQLETMLPEDTLSFSDGKNTLVVSINDDKTRQQFQTQWQQQQDTLQKVARKYEWGYLPISTDTDYVSDLIHFCFGDIIYAA